MQIVSWNVNGVRASVGKGLIDIIIQSSADVYCLQETKAQESKKPTKPRNEKTMEPTVGRVVWLSWSGAPQKTNFN